MKYQQMIQPGYLGYFEWELAYTGTFLDGLTSSVEKRQTLKTIGICALASIVAAGAVVFFLKKK
jgi:hypothetical protein